jgi:hypothetical protein
VLGDPTERLVQGTVGAVLQELSFVEVQEIHVLLLRLRSSGWKCDKMCPVRY